MDRRASPRPSPSPSVVGIILAGGTSTRMGHPKQLLPYRGRPLLQHVIDAAEAGGIQDLVLVLGHHAAEIEGSLRLPPAGRVVLNPDYRSGQASSLRAGLEALPGNVGAAAILLGDQPGIPPDAIRAALETYARTGGPVIRTEYRGVPGHPVILDRGVWKEVAGTGGDRGAGPALERHPEWVVPLRLDLPSPAEVDTPEDYRSLVEAEPPEGPSTGDQPHSSPSRPDPPQ